NPAGTLIGPERTRSCVPRFLTVKVFVSAVPTNVLPKLTLPLFGTETVPSSTCACGPAGRGATHWTRTASAITLPLARSDSCTASVWPRTWKVPRSCQLAPASLRPAGAACWLTATVPRGVLPSSTVYGALVARLDQAVQVTATRYWPGTRLPNVQV